MAQIDSAPAVEVILDATVKNKRELFDLLSRAAERVFGSSQQEVLQGLQAREKLGSTGVGQGVAIPHAQLPSVTRSSVLLVRLAQPIEFGAPDNAPADLILLVLWPPGDSKSFLGSMSRICRAMRDAGTRELLRHLTESTTVREVLREMTV